MTKRRFVFLDGLRGIAAFSVAWLHAGIDFNQKYFPAHGYLAVDFFFCLSGFVVAYAYEARIKTGMAFGVFCAARFTRLYPMIFMAALLANAIYVLATPLVGFSQLMLLSASVFLLLPFGLFFHLQAFPANGPVWSLCFEVFANALYFADAKQAVPQFRKYVVILACFGIALGFIIIRVGTVSAVGFASPQSFIAGFTRVLYSFLVGVMIFRFGGGNLCVRLPGWVLVAILALVLCMPVPPEPWIYDIVAILIIFPVIVALGAKVQPGGMAPVWEFCGRMSYPLYIIHQPVMRATHYLFYPGVGRPYPAFVALASLLISTVLAYVLLVAFDEPLRLRLTPRRKPAGTEASAD
jgi:peptidoglycan/LPS O-acetylase OafA/YrhL